jgi:hypothetical protein
MAPSSTLRPCSSASWWRSACDGQALHAGVERAALHAGPSRRGLAREVRRQLLAQRHAAAARRAARSAARTPAQLSCMQLQHPQARSRHALGLALGRAPAPRRWRPLRVQPAGVLAEQRLRQRGTPTTSPRKGTAFSRPRGSGSSSSALELARPPPPGRSSATLRPPAGRARPSSIRPASCIVSVDAPRVRVFHQVGPGARATACPVDAAVLPEAPVLAEHDGLQQRRRHRPAAPRAAGAPTCRHAGLHRHAVAVEQRQIRRPVRGAHLVEARQRRRRRRAARAQREQRAFHGATSTAAFGPRRRSRARTSPPRAWAAARSGPGCSAARCTRSRACRAAGTRSSCGRPRSCAPRRPTRRCLPCARRAWRWPSRGPGPSRAAWRRRAPGR